MAPAICKGVMRTSSLLRRDGNAVFSPFSDWMSVSRSEWFTGFIYP